MLENKRGKGGVGELIFPGVLNARWRVNPLSPSHSLENRNTNFKIIMNKFSKAFVLVKALLFKGQMMYLRI